MLLGSIKKNDNMKMLQNPKINYWSIKGKIQKDIWSDWRWRMKVKARQTILVIRVILLKIQEM